MSAHIEPVAAAVDAALREIGAEPGSGASVPAAVAAGVSGGRDSMTLLHALARARATHPIRLSAIHVHHGLSPNADAWARFCDRECARMNVPLEIEHVNVVARGGDSIEAAARGARMHALLRSKVDAVALAHHADDQAETLLLQLMRGAGPHGLAAMAPQRQRPGEPRVLRPFLALPGAILAAYAEAQGVQWIEDESNAETRYRRNALRHRVVPMLRETFPGYPGTLVRAARHQAEAAGLLDELAAMDAAAIARRVPALGLALDADALRALQRVNAARARNLLRWFVREHGLHAPTTARLEQMLRQCTTDRRDARIAIHHDDAHVAVHDGLVVVHRSPAPRAFSLAWHGEMHIDCPGGILQAREVVGGGIAASVVFARALRLASRAGGERLRLASDRPHQAVSAWLSRTRTPLWQRDHWPLVWHEDVLVAVPGLGIDPAYLAPPGAPGYELAWQPRA